MVQVSGIADIESGSTTNTAARQKQVAFSNNFYTTRGDHGPEGQRYPLARRPQTSAWLPALARPPIA